MKSNTSASLLSVFLFLSRRFALKFQEPKATAGVPAISPHEVEKIGVGASHLDGRPFIYEAEHDMKKMEGSCVFEPREVKRLIDFSVCLENQKASKTHRRSFRLMNDNSCSILGTLIRNTVLTCHHVPLFTSPILSLIRSFRSRKPINK